MICIQNYIYSSKYSGFFQILIHFISTIKEIVYNIAGKIVVIVHDFSIVTNSIEFFPNNEPSNLFYFHN